MSIDKSLNHGQNVKVRKDKKELYSRIQRGSIKNKGKGEKMKIEKIK
jgi:hypothetical protein